MTRKLIFDIFKIGDNMETKYDAESKELHNIVMSGVTGQTRIVNLGKSMSDTIGRGRHETEMEMKENYRKTFGNSNVQYGNDMTVRLAQGTSSQVESMASSFAKPKKVGSAVQKKNSVNIKKAIMAVGLTLALGGGLTACSELKENVEQDHFTVVSTIDAGDYHPQLEGIELIEYADGRYAFKDADGDTFAKYGNGEYIIDANELGQSLENSQSGPTL